MTGARFFFFFFELSNNLRNKLRVDFIGFVS